MNRSEIAYCCGFRGYGTAVFGKKELALHALNDARQHLVGFIPISFAEFDTPDRPIGIEPRFWSFRHDQNANKSFTIWRGFHFLGDRLLQIGARTRNSIIEHFRKR